MTITGYDPKKTATMNDFFDMQVMTIPLAYADVLVAPDKWIRHTLTVVPSVTGTKRAKYISNFDEFESYLLSIH